MPSDLSSRMFFARARAAALALPALGIACSPAHSSPLAPQSRPASAASPAPSPNQETTPVVQPRAPVSTTGCPLQWTPHDLGASVLRIPKTYAGRFMYPLIDAACACVRPGERVHIVARVVPELGSFEAVTANHDPGTDTDPSIEACLAAVLGEVTFEPFDVGSDVICPEEPPPKTGMGPPVFRPPRLSRCPEMNQRTRINYPLLVDRCNEAPSVASAGSRCK